PEWHLLFLSLLFLFLSSAQVGTDYVCRRRSCGGIPTDAAAAPTRESAASLPIGTAPPKSPSDLDKVVL
ncbi:unnamed protein product, partial [Urochloa humidicola]